MSDPKLTGFWECGKCKRVYPQSVDGCGGCLSRVGVFDVGAQDGPMSPAHLRGRVAERAAIVEWIRGGGTPAPESWLSVISDAIERGAHLK